jgi:ABC-type transport system substrate-binding protein
VRAFPREGDEPIGALLRGEIDVFVGGWDEDLPAERLHDLRRDPRVRVVDAPGSSVVSLGFSLRGPTADRGLRRRIAAAISRSELIRSAEGGFADPCTAWAPPAVKAWPQPGAGSAVEGAAGSGTNGAIERPLRITAGRTLVRRFGSGSRGEGVPDDLRALVDEAAGTPDEAKRMPIYARIQEVLDRECLIVPLYAPRRIAVHTADVEGVRLGIDVYHVDLTGLRRR